MGFRAWLVRWLLAPELKRLERDTRERMRIEEEQSRQRIAEREKEAEEILRTVDAYRLQKDHNQLRHQHLGLINRYRKLLSKVPKQSR